MQTSELIGRRARLRYEVRREVIEQELGGDDFAQAFPSWLHNVAFFGYREQGWVASVMGIGTVATGAWGDHIWRLPDGKYGCEEYPNGYSIEAAVERGRVKYAAEIAALEALRARNEGEGA